VIARILKDPLGHFLAGGLLLFVAFQLFATDAAKQADDSVIAVTRPALLEFIQFRSKAFDPAVAVDTLDTMSDAERQRLIDDYVREEALYRKARDLGLDANDYVIKRRVIQTLEFVVGHATEQQGEPHEDEIEAYYQAHQQDYAQPPAATFTHVFVSGDGRDAGSARQKAETLLAQLNREGAAFADAPRFGDRFVYNVNYVRQSADAVAGHFGTGFAEALFALTPDPARWQGPIPSAYGLHLVLMTAKTSAVVPPLDEVRGRVVADFEADRAEEARDKAIEQIVSSFDIRIDLAATGQQDRAGD